MLDKYQDLIQKSIKDAKIIRTEKIQSLWSGYGQLLRVHLQHPDYSSIILKHIKLPQPSSHPRGWHSKLSHQRKLNSYQVETHWYQHYANLCIEKCPVPTCINVQENDTEINLLLTDLNEAGFSQLKNEASIQDIYACLNWLAYFHAIFLHSPTDGLWETGTYWHLATRPDELHALEDPLLKQAAPLIDKTLKEAKYQTLVHGDAKLANFCFAPHRHHGNATLVAAVDFQYIGGGCGMKDVCYFIGSCLHDRDCEALEDELLDYYFKALRAALAELRPEININELEQEWRSLFDVAWADFHRFLKGWSPNHWKLNSYSEQLTQRVIKRLIKSDT